MTYASIDHLYVKGKRSYKKYRKVQLYHLLELIKKGNTRNEVNRLIPCAEDLYNDILRMSLKYKAKDKEYNLKLEKRYWETEDEMTIQNYKVEDLKGDELLILNSIKWK
jgi:hypothetical protein